MFLFTTPIAFSHICTYVRLYAAYVCQALHLSYTYKQCESTSLKCSINLFWMEQAISEILHGNIPRLIPYTKSRVSHTEDKNA